MNPRPIRSEPELRRIRFLVSHFDEMQGLRTAAWMLWIVCYVAIWPSIPRSGWMWVVWVLPFVFYAPLIGEPLRRYYARRLGRVAGRHFPSIELRWGAWLMGATVLMRVSHPNPALWLCWAAYPIYVLASGWRYRAYHLLTLAAASYFAWTCLSASGVLPDAQSDRALLTLIVALTATALCDHLLLMRTLTGLRLSAAS
jgi:hypothetical protein